MTGTISVEVVFVASNSQAFHTLELPEDATVASAIEAAGLAAEFPDYSITDLPVGIWGRLVSAGKRLQDGDRVEVYRELLIDPMEARRLRALEPVPDPCESR